VVGGAGARQAAVTGVRSLLLGGGLPGQVFDAGCVGAFGAAFLRRFAFTP